MARAIWGVALLRMALLLGFDVTVLEDRPYFADGARRAGAKRVICDSFEQGLDAVDSDEDTYFVVMSRGHRYDMVCLKKIVKKTYAYLGMMGSKGRSALVRKNLLEQGVPAEQVEALHAPIGLTIHAETPEEIAVSILGEIISIKNQEKKTCGFSEEQMAILQDETDTRAKVLCTIVARGARRKKRRYENAGAGGRHRIRNHRRRLCGSGCEGKSPLAYAG